MIDDMWQGKQRYDRYYQIMKQSMFISPYINSDFVNRLSF